MLMLRLADPMEPANPRPRRLETMTPEAPKGPCSAEASARAWATPAPDSRLDPPRKRPVVRANQT